MNYYDKNLLKIVCEYGYLDIVKKLLEGGVKINMWIDMEIFLIVVCKNGYQSIVRELLKLGVSVNKRDFLYVLL